jgi:hypothetical protein
MSFGKVEAGKGIEWIKSAFNIVMRNPGVFVVIALIIGVLGAIPIINLAMIVIGPALYGGFMYAAHRQDNGETPEIGDVFAAFKIPGKAGPMLMLCLPSIAAAIVLGVLGFILVGGALMAAMSGSGGLGAAGMGGILLFGVLALAVALLVGAMMFFAIPRVMLDNVEPIAALKESVSAVLANIVAVLLFFVVMFVGVFVLAIVVGWIPLVGALVLMLATSIVFTLGSYSAYKDVFANSGVVYAPPPAPPVV